MVSLENTKINLPGLICDLGKYGFNSNIIAKEFLKNNRFVIPKGPALQIIEDTVQHIINTSIGYNDGEVITTPHKRFQIIINSELLEMLLASFDSFVRNSNSEWLLGGKYEVGADFKTIDGHDVEAKVYFSLENM